MRNLKSHVKDGPIHDVARALHQMPEKIYFSNEARRVILRPLREVITWGIRDRILLTAMDSTDKLKR